MYRPVTYDHRTPPACRVMPTFFLLRVSVPFYQVVRICRQMAAKLRMQGYHTLFYVSKLGYICACIYMQPLKCGNSDIFACHIENRAYGFLAGVWLQRTVSSLCLHQGYRNFEIQIGPLDRWCHRRHTNMSSTIPNSHENSSFSSKSVSEIDYFSDTVQLQPVVSKRSRDNPKSLA